MTETTCIQHGTWGIECGPECERLTKAWNDGQRQGYKDALDSLPNSATVDIVDVEPNAIQVRGRDLRRGDYVFDTNGGTYKIVSIYTKGTRVVFRRNDMHQDSIGTHETITILRYEEDPRGASGAQNQR
jgi:hypothetical protein